MDHEASPSEPHALGRPAALISGYARAGDLRIAYEVAGNGPPLVFAGSSFTNQEALWDDPEAATFFNRLARVCTLVRFDMLGVGGSDRPARDESPPLPDQLLAVLDALEIGRASVLGLLQGGVPMLRFAAENPGRVDKLILWNSTARILRDEGYDIGVDPKAYEQLTEFIVSNWGTEAIARMNLPSRANDRRFLEWYLRYMRSSASPGQVMANLRQAQEEDARDLLGDIVAPTLVLARVAYNAVPSAQGRYMAERIPQGEFVEVPGGDGPMYWEHADFILDHIERFVTGTSAGRTRPETLTIMFTDIVGSTEMASAKGDVGWSAILAEHDEIVMKWASAESGRVVKHTGDGFLVEFPSPSLAIIAARGIRDALERLHIRLRIGIHTAEVERRGEDLEGLGVVAAARIMARATAGQILVSSTVRSLLLGSPERFEPAGHHTLKGLEGEWDLYSSS